MLKKHLTLLIINVENSCAASYIHILFQDSLMSKKFKQTAFI